MSMKEVRINEADNLKKAKRIFKGIDFKVLSKAIVALFSSSSEHHSHDCIGMAVVAMDFLKRKGLKPELVVGEAAWRVDGKSGGAVISHVSDREGVSMKIEPETEDGEAFPFHAWIKLNDYWFFDLSTYQFQMKMDALNQDGQNAPVTWKPDFLLFSQSDINGFQTVQQCYSSKVIYYEPVPALMDRVKAKREPIEADKEDVDALEVIYSQIKQGSLQVVIGPFGTAEIS